MWAQTDGESTPAADPPAADESAESPESQEESSRDVADVIDDWAGKIVGPLAKVLFFDPVAAFESKPAVTPVTIRDSAIESLRGVVWLSPSDIAALDGTDVDVDAEPPTVTVGGTKIPLSGGVAASLEAWLTERAPAQGALFVDPASPSPERMTAEQIAAIADAAPDEAVRDAAIRALASARFPSAEIAGLKRSNFNAGTNKLSFTIDDAAQDYALESSILDPLRAWVRRWDARLSAGTVGAQSALFDVDSTTPTDAAAVSTIVRSERPVLRFIVLWLIFGAVTFTLIMGFINVRGLRHAIDLVRGVYTDKTSAGEVSHFQALSAALSATVGLGNIAGVAVAVSMGGPGAVFWMVASAFFGMTSKFVECTLGQKYREIDEHGRVSGGAMHYLRRGLEEMKLGPLGAVLAVVFAVLCIGGSFGGGNMFQANQSFEALSSSLGLEEEAKATAAIIYGAVLASLVGLVVIGGIRRIATTASRIVPAMCAAYVLGSIYILLSNFTAIPDAFARILTEAFTPDAVQGGFLGVLVLGVQRAAFSNEAGVGSAAIAHSAAKTDEPVREGLVALLEPFIDTIIVCTMTGLVIVITNAYQMPEFKGSVSTDGAKLTVAAWGTVGSYFPWVLTVATVLFAFSTLISWFYYGERCWSFLFGDAASMIYKILFVGFVFVGSVSSLGNVIAFSDMMILGMAFPNLLGCLLLSGKVRRDLSEYWKKYRSGAFPRAH